MKYTGDLPETLAKIGLRVPPQLLFPAICNTLRDAFSTASALKLDPDVVLNLRRDIRPIKGLRQRQKLRVVNEISFRFCLFSIHILLATSFQSQKPGPNP